MFWGAKVKEKIVDEKRKKEQTNRRKKKRNELLQMDKIDREREQEYSLLNSYVSIRKHS